MKNFKFLLRLFMAVLLCALAGAGMLLQATLATMAIVAIRAEIATDGNKDHMMEKAAGKLTVLQGVTYVGWEVAQRETE